MVVRSKHSKSNGNLWGIILAGGAGKRLRSFTEKLYGYPRPKQYCVITGNRSMLEHTLNRARLLIPPNRLVTVVTQSHRRYIEEINHGQPLETFVVQPECRDTGPGIVLPLLKIFHVDPMSIVVTLPSDHFVVGSWRFMGYIRLAADFVNAYPDFIVLIGVKPHRCEIDYGWVEPGKAKILHRDMDFKAVHRFLEKPPPGLIEALLATGCLWNTFVLIGRATTFLKRIQEHVPEMLSAFKAIPRTFNTIHEEAAIEKAYTNITSTNFSKSVLEQVARHLVVLEALDIYWSDWGTENRIQQDIERFGLRLNSAI
ncbi:MAG: sugar phosphate nucleotidyltransferase [Bellilinea sp.]|jgi:mannose-1-phosphate guanylyltransferase